MSNPTNIVFPTLDLFLYDLKDGLGEDKKITDEKCKDFCEKLFGDLDEKTFNDKYAQIQKHIDNEADGIDLLETRFRKFDSPVDGYYYPRKFSDTYALLVEYSGKLDANGKSNDQPQDISDDLFQNYKQEIQKRISYKQDKTNQANFYESGTIGQTWLAWGKLEEHKSDREIEEAAKELYTQISTNYKWDNDFIGKGELCGGTIFELWYHPQILDFKSKEFWDKFRRESHHVLIWLFPENISTSEMRNQVQTMYQDFMRLFHYRHKIVWAYYQSRDLKTKLKKKFIDIQDSISKARQLQTQLNKAQLNLNELQKDLTDTLISLSDYTIELNNLYYQICTIKTNQENYQYRLEKITREHQTSNLKCLEEFSQSEIYAKKYLRQTETDYANLTPGLTVVQNLSNTLQGIIQLEQTKSDRRSLEAERKLDNTIALVGVGLAISGLTASVATQYLPKPQKYPQGYDFSIASVMLSPAFVLSIIVSAPFLLALIYRLFRR